MGVHTPEVVNRRHHGSSSGVGVDRVDARSASALHALVGAFAPKGRRRATFTSTLGAYVNKYVFVLGSGENLGVIGVNIKIPDEKVSSGSLKDALDGVVKKQFVLLVRDVVGLGRSDAQKVGDGDMVIALVDVNDALLPPPAIEEDRIERILGIVGWLSGRSLAIDHDHTSRGSVSPRGARCRECPGRNFGWNETVIALTHQKTDGWTVGLASFVSCRQRRWAPV